MNDSKKQNKITLILLIIFVITTITLGAYIVYDKTLSKTDTDDIKENVENDINNKIKEYIEENYLVSFMEYSNPENLLKENNKSYLELAIQYSKNAEIQHQYEDYIGSYSISLDNIKTFLKEKFNYNYTEEEIKEYFKIYYVEKYNTYMIPVSGGLISPQIKNIEEINDTYKINIYLESDDIEEGTVIIKEENNQFYFYSSTGLN